jgi:hypothetical protein
LLVRERNILFRYRKEKSRLLKNRQSFSKSLWDLKRFRTK